MYLAHMNTTTVHKHIAPSILFIARFTSTPTWVGRAFSRFDQYTVFQKNM